jgi:class 3 adenylate cyclase/predicted ATPase
MECGSKIGSPIDKPSSPEKTTSFPKGENKPRRAAERRQLTILFCDLVGSTPLSELLDPEDYRQVILGYQQVAEKVIKRYGGYIAQYLGDGLLVYFGYPEALEDASKAGVRTGLGILEAVAHANQQWIVEGKTEIDIRIGIHSGLVVVDDHLALGDTVNIAARLEGIAPVNGVVISQQTLKLVQGWFEVKSIGNQQLKGISKPIEVFQVFRESGAQTRLEAAEGRGLSPLVGRDQERQLMKQRWIQAKAGKGNLVLLSGEAGIGKSRMVDTLKKEIAQEPQSWLTEIRCSSYHQNSSFYPIIDLLENVVLQFERQESFQNKLIKLEGFLIQSGLDPITSMPLFAEFLSIVTEQYPPSNMSPFAKKQRIIECLTLALLHRASIQPVFLVVEDLHWADASTLEWLQMLIEQLPTQPIFAIGTTRPGFQPEWIGRTYVSQWVLQRLTPEKVADICQYYTKGKALPTTILEQINAKTEGVPLFVEELTKMVLETGLLVEKENSFELIGELPPLAIPSTLQDLLLARLDRLSMVKEVVQLGAVLGREFSFELINVVIAMEEEKLKHILTKLVEAEILYQKGIGEQAVYQFKHALIQDAAYASMLKSRRQLMHRRVAEVLEEQFKEMTASQPELLAFHYSEGRLSKHALPYWQKAGEAAQERSASLEASAHFYKAIEELNHFTTSSERQLKEIELLILLIASLRESQGYASVETVKALERVHELIAITKNTETPFPVLFGFMTSKAALGDLLGSRKVALEFTNRAIQIEDEGLIQVGERFLGIFELFGGSLIKANSFFESALSRYRKEEHQNLGIEYGSDSRISCLVLCSWVKYLLGYPDQAFAFFQQALIYAQESDHANTKGYAFGFGAYLALIAQDEDYIQECSEQLDLLKEEFPLPFWLAYGELAKGWLQVKAGQVENGIELIKKGGARMKATGAGAFQFIYQITLAEVYIKSGYYIQAEKTLVEMEALTQKQYVIRWNGEIQRMWGELKYRSASDDLKKIEDCFLASLEHGQNTGARILELRAATSLADFWGNHGKLKEALELLEPLYQQFEKGHQNRTLKEALKTIDKLKTLKAQQK